MLSRKELKEHFHDFANNTTISGINYIADKSINWKLRLFWIFVFVFSIIYTGWLIVTRYKKWEANRLSVATDSEYTYAYEIPYPTMTICPPPYYAAFNVPTVERLFAERFTKTKISLTENDVEKLKSKIKVKTALELMAQVCNAEFDIPSQYKDQYFQEVRDTYTNMTYSISKVLPPVNTVGLCTFRQDHPKCSTIVAETITEHGFCYTFNQLEKKDLYNLSNVRDPYPKSNNLEKGRILSNWDLDRGYNGIINESYPFRMPDPYTPFSFAYGSDQYTKIPNCGGGFKFGVHLPGELVQGRRKIYEVSGNKKYFVTILPKIRKTDLKLKKFPPTKRKCYFNDEKKLKYFNIYTEDNCGLECLTTYVIRKCNCVPYFLPQDKNYEMCSIKNYECYRSSKFAFDNKRYFFENDLDWKNCDCLPSCNYIEYETFVTETEAIPNKQSLQVRLDFVFEIFKYRAEVQNEDNDILKFISEFGGLFGLLLGMSLFSVMELLYYFCFAFIFHRNQRKYEFDETEMMTTTANDAAILAVSCTGYNKFDGDVLKDSNIK